MKPSPAERESVSSIRARCGSTSSSAVAARSPLAVRGRHADVAARGSQDTGVAFLEAVGVLPLGAHRLRRGTAIGRALGADAAGGVGLDRCAARHAERDDGERNDDLTHEDERVPNSEQEGVGGMGPDVLLVLAHEGILSGP